MKVLLIGGTGFIGRQIADRLLTLGHLIGVFHRGETAAASLTNVTHFLGNQSEKGRLVSSIESFSPDVVVSLIAYTADDADSVLEACRNRTERIVCLSSMDVYAAYGQFRRLEKGRCEKIPFDEAASLRTVLYPYRALATDETDLRFNYEKILVEQILLGQDDMPCTILRLGKVFGPHDSQHYLATYLEPIERQADIMMTAPKSNWRWTRCYVEDAALAVSLTVDHPTAGNRVYNVGDAHAQSEAEWIRQIGEVAGWQGNIIIGSAFSRPDENDAYDWNCDLEANTARIRTELHYRETLSTREALSRTIRWERSQRPK